MTDRRSSDTSLSPEALIRWKERHGLSNPTAAFVLGLSIGAFRKYVTGERPISLQTRLLMRYVEAAGVFDEQGNLKRLTPLPGSRAA
jgi:hypothetical protein